MRLDKRLYVAGHLRFLGRVCVFEQARDSFGPKTFLGTAVSTSATKPIIPNALFWCKAEVCSAVCLPVRIHAACVAHVAPTRPALGAVYAAREPCTLPLPTFSHALLSSSHAHSLSLLPSDTPGLSSCRLCDSGPYTSRGCRARANRERPSSSLLLVQVVELSMFCELRYFYKTSAVWTTCTYKRGVILIDVHCLLPLNDPNLHTSLAMNTRQLVNFSVVQIASIFTRLTYNCISLYIYSPFFPSTTYSSLHPPTPPHNHSNSTSQYP